MNHVYSKVWSQALGAWVVASELASRQGRCVAKGGATLVLSVLASAILPAMAQTVTVDERETTGDFERGIELLAGPAGEPIHLTSGRVTTSGRYAEGIFVDAGADADSVVESDLVTVSGEGANGLVVLAYNGDITIESGTVESLYEGGIPEDNAEHGLLTDVAGAGVWGTSTYGDVRVTSETVTTLGEGAYGVGAQSGWAVTDASGDVFLSSGRVSTAGGYAIGLYAETSGTGAVTAINGSVATAGDRAHGIWAQSHGGAVEVESAAVETEGYRAFGISAQGEDNVLVRSEDVRTAGDLSYGIQSYSGSGSIGIESGTVATSGTDAYGILAEASNNISIRSESVETTGQAAYGIGAAGEGRIDIDSGTVATAGEGAIAIAAYSGREIVIDSGAVTTSGDRADGIGVDEISAEGSVTVASGSATTGGEAANAIRINGGSHIDVTSGEVATAGDLAEGIVISGVANGGTVAVDSGRVTTSGMGAEGILVRGDLAELADVTVRSESIRVDGAASVGLAVLARSGDIAIDSGEVLATHVGAVPEAAAGNALFNVPYGVGIWASSGTGNIQLASDRVVTAGDDGWGVVARTQDGSIDIDSGLVSTSGNRAQGIAVDVGNRGSIRIESDVVATTGQGSSGIRANTGLGGGDIVVVSGEVELAHRGTGIEAFSQRGHVSITSGRIVAGGEATGIVAHGYSGAVVDSGSISVDGGRGVWAVAIDGDVLVDVTGGIDAGQGWAVDARASGAVHLEIGQGQVVSGAGGATLESRTGTTVDIHGEIIGTANDALRIIGGAATINNYSNTIVGSIQLTDEDDVFNNVGTWVATGSSGFGAGGDLLLNTGLVRANAVGTTRIEGLTTFANEGVLDLANGSAGDRLEMPGTTLVGGEGSTIHVDVDFATGSSDALAVEAIAGSSVIRVNDASTGSGFDLEGISIIESAQPLDGSEFSMDLGLGDSGLVAYGLEFDPASNRFLVTALPGAASFELIKAGAAAQDFWAKSGDAWAARMIGARDGFAAGTARPGSGAWLQGHAGGLDFENSGRFDLGGGSVERDMSTESGWSGVQAGYDRTWTDAGGGALLGLTAGYTNYSLDFTSSAGRYELDGANVGVYGAIGRGAFFAQGLVKVDRFSGEVRTAEAALAGDIEGSTRGVSLEAGLRFGDRVWIEPVAGASWVRASIDGFRSDLVDADFDDATSLQTRAGLRIGGSGVVSGATLVPSLGLYAVDEHRGENGTVLWLGDEGNRATDTPHGSYTRAEASLTLVTGGVEVFIRGGADFGGGTDGFNGRAGLRWSW